MVKGDSTPLGNGTALVNALALVGPTSATQRWLIKLEPGVFQLTAPLSLKSFVDLEGSGRGVTVLRSKFGAALVLLPTVKCSKQVRAEVRELSIEAKPSSGIATAVLFEGSACSLDRVALDATAPVFAYGLWASGKLTQPQVRESTIRASSTTGAAFGVSVFNGATLSLNDLDISVSSSDNVALFLSSASVVADRLSIQAQGKQSTGIHVTQTSSAVIRRSRVAVEGSGTALQVSGNNDLTVVGSELRAKGTNGTGIAIDQPHPVLHLEQTAIIGARSLRVLAPASIEAVISQLSGTVTSAAGASVKCAGAYRSLSNAFKALKGDCTPP